MAGSIVPQGHRDYARQHAAQGVALLAHAINACNRDDATYRYSKEQQRKFARIVRELVELVEFGEIVAFGSARAPTASEHDRGFQRFMALLNCASARKRRRKFD